VGASVAHWRRWRRTAWSSWRGSLCGQCNACCPLASGTLSGPKILATGVRQFLHSIARQCATLQGALHAWGAPSSTIGGSPDGERSHIAFLDGPSSLAQLAGWGAIPTPSGHFGPVNDLTWSSDGSYFLTVSDDATTRVWSPCAEPIACDAIATDNRTQRPIRWQEIGRPQIHGYPMVAIAAASIPGVPHRVLSAGG
jgi:hypothetical protein